MSDAMQAIAIHPLQAGSGHLREIPAPSLDEIADGHGVLVDVIRVGLDGTDRELVNGRYGEAPPGADFLVLGHESLGRVRAVGPAVAPSIVPGTLVVATVRRPATRCSIASACRTCRLTTAIASTGSIDSMAS